MIKTFIYIDYFEFKEEHARKEFYGHPKEGKVYSAIKDGDLYRVPLNSISGMEGVILSKREYNGEGKWNYKIEEINEDSLADFDLSIEDLEIIEKGWVSGKYENNEIEEKEELPLESLPLPELHDKLFKEVALMRKFDDMNEFLNVIAERDDNLFHVVYDVVKQLSEDVDDEYYALKQSLILNINKLNKIRRNKE